MMRFLRRLVCGFNGHAMKPFGSRIWKCDMLRCSKCGVIKPRLEPHYDDKD